MSAAPRAVTVAVAPLIVSAWEAAAEETIGEWLLRPYLEADVLALMYGDYGTLKSFIALDWSMRIALGWPAIGHDFRRQARDVVFMSAEGKGLWKRLRGWCVHNCPSEEWQTVLKRARIYVVRRPVNLSDPSAMVHMIAGIDELAIEPALIVVDTLSRNSSGEVEKSTGDAAAYLNAIDEHLRVRFGCSVLFVHHVGHVDKERHRGPIVLASNTDAELRITRPVANQLEVTLEVARLKDSDVPAAIGLRGVVVDLGVVDADGHPQTTLAIEGMDEAPGRARREPSGSNQQTMLGAVRQYVSEHGEMIATPTWHELCRAQCLAKSRWSETRDALTKAGWLVEAVGGLRYVP